MLREADEATREAIGRGAVSVAQMEARLYINAFEPIEAVLELARAAGRGGELRATMVAALLEPVEAVLDECVSELGAVGGELGAVSRELRG